MKIFSSKKRVAAIGVVTAATLVGGGAAYAFWTTTGSGTDTVTTSAGVNNTLTFSNNSPDALFPGQDPQALVVTVENTGAQAAYVTAIEAYVTTNKAGCDGSDYRINGVATDEDTKADIDWDPVDIPGGDSANSSANTNTIQFYNKPTDQQACKGATVTINYSSM